jgi:hypothetical protein
MGRLAGMRSVLRGCGARQLRVVAIGFWLVGMLVAPAVASADRYVSHTSVSGAKDHSCATAPYRTVQGAVDAARPGERVYLCGTAPYVESVVVQKDLRLTGDRGATIEAPADPAAPTTFFSSRNLQTPYSVLTVLGAANVQVTGVTIEGPFANSDFCNATDVGVLQIGSGELQLAEDKVLDIEAADQADLGGCSAGFGVQIGSRYWPAASGSSSGVLNFPGSAQIRNVSVSGYQGLGILADGPGTHIQLSSSDIDGSGPSALVSRYGVQVSRGATGRVTDNSISDNEYTGTAFFNAGAGVLVFGGCGDPVDVGVQVDGNRLTNDDSGVASEEFDPTCSFATSTPTHNQIDGDVIAKNDGETNQSPTPDEAGNTYAGYQVGIADNGSHDEVDGNTITGTIVDGSDTAFGPQTTPGGDFLAPIDIQTFPPIDTQVRGNTYDGRPTSPPY